MVHDDTASKSIRTARLRAGYSQVALARAAGCHPSTISLAERGVISRRIALRLSRLLHVDLSSAIRLPEDDET